MHMALAARPNCKLAMLLDSPFQVRSGIDGPVIAALFR